MTRLALDQLVKTFKIEMEELLSILEKKSMQLEKTSEKAEKKEVIEDLFRAAHNLKGAAYSVGFKAVGDIAHAMESLMAEVKKKQNASLEKKAVERLLFAVDFLKASNLEQGNEQSASQAVLDVTSMLAGKKELTENLDNMLKKKVIQSEKNETLKIATQKIANVSALTDELQTIKLELDDAFQKIKATSSKLMDDKNSGSLIKKNIYELQKEMRGIVSHLHLTSGALQHEIRYMRLMPIAIVLDPLARSVRDIALQLNKKIVFSVLGDDVEMDRSILNILHDPLLHIVRNSIDHGIELPKDRVDQGKTAEGHIKVEVSNDAGKIQIQIEDDGRGIDTGEVSALALKKGLVSEAELEKMTDAEKLRLIFQPGFSTKEKVTEISGRGFGMDIVETNIRNAKGKVEIQSELRKGTRITLTLPFTLMTDRGMFVSVGEESYVIPTYAICKILHLPAEDIFSVEGKKAILFEGVPIKVHPLADLLKVPNVSGIHPKQNCILVIQRLKDKVALLVDRFLGEREMIIKNMNYPLKAVKNILGGTLNARGEVVMILDPTDLAEAVLRAEGCDFFAPQKEKAQNKICKILVVDDSITTRTLETNILTAKGYQVTCAVDGLSAWNLLKNEKFDLVLSDVEMPNMDGFTLTEKIKADPHCKNIPVIIVTSHGSESDRLHGMQAGADAYLVKNQFDTEKLTQVIERLL